LQSFGSTAFEQRYKGTPLDVRVASANLSVEQSKVNI
jgi:hypothetical protein